MEKFYSILRSFSLFELFLALFTFYAIYEGEMKVLVPCFCLVTAFLFEKLQEKVKESQRKQS